MRDRIAFIFYVFLIGFVSIPVSAISAGAKEMNRAVMATGAVTSGYYLLGSGICAEVNEAAGPAGLHCAVETSKGTVANLQALWAGTVDLALAQSDWQYHAFAGTVGQFSGDKAIKDMRALMSLGGSPLVLLARADGGIKTLEDLAGKQLDIGKKGTGRRAAMDDLLVAMGWDLGKFKLASELPEADAIKDLCGGKLDALVLAGVTPDKNVTLAMRTCPLKIVPIDGTDAGKLIKAKLYYSAVAIPKGAYPGLKTDVFSVGLRVILLASGKVSDENGYAIVKAVAGNLEAVRKLHPSFASINRAGMAKAGIAVPLQNGAAKFYREAK
ncbi:MAG: TAXI family TRAP transporter solute-binding subunit [Alphaproteobacteria bacterium]|nr:TAXI family TRAP transporter solute-binding subunit [Alphaproteobacteria bacterium]